MNKVICKGLIYEHNGEIKCVVPNCPVVIVSPTEGAFRYSDGAYMGDDLQVIKCEPDTRWFKSKEKEEEGVIEKIVYHDTAIIEYIQEITDGKSDAEKRLKKIKEIVEE